MIFLKVPMYRMNRLRRGAIALCLALTVPAALLGGSPPARAASGTLRLLTWSDYAPADVVAQFEKETGVKVALTLSNNEEMIAKLRATGGAGFDLTRPSIDRVAQAASASTASTSPWIWPEWTPAASIPICCRPARANASSTASSLPCPTYGEPTASSPT